MGSIEPNVVPLRRSPDLVLKTNTPKGRGVFAARDIKSGTIIEVSPVLVLEPQENEHYVRKTSLYHYTYNWHIKRHDGQKIDTQAVILGLGSMFNHSRQRQNVGWTKDEEKLTVTYKTLRDVTEGEELCISYGDRLTFTDVEESSAQTEKAEEFLEGIQID